MWGKKKVAIVFVALLAVCVIAIVVVLVLNKDNFSGQEETTGGFPTSMHTEKLEEVNELAAGMSVDDAKALYEDVIANAEDDLSRAEARVEYGRYLLSNGEEDNAVVQFEGVDENILGAGYKILYYSALREYYDLIDAEEASEEYNEKIKVVTAESDYAAGG